MGKLTDRQADQIRLILKVVQDENEVVTRLKDVVVQETKAYLDIAVVNDLWDQWELDQAFDYNVTEGPLPTHTVARILTINRCTDPCSHYSVPMWAKKTGLEDVLRIDLSGLNDDKLYYELDKINLNKISIENHLFNLTYKKDPESYGFITCPHLERARKNVMEDGKCYSVFLLTIRDIHSSGMYSLETLPRLKHSSEISMPARADSG
jgi:hypothetical protein